MRDVLRFFSVPCCTPAFGQARTWFPRSVWVYPDATRLRPSFHYAPQTVKLARQIVNALVFKLDPLTAANQR